MGDRGETPSKQSTAYSLENDSKLNFEDSDLDKAAKILRLLQIHNVREVQTKINETIVAVQELTANPKTDTKIGKVGF